MLHFGDGARAGAVIFGDEEFSVLEELIAERVAQRKTKEPEYEPIEVGQVYLSGLTGRVEEVIGHDVVNQRTTLRPLGAEGTCVFGPTFFREQYTRLPYRRESEVS